MWLVILFVVAFVLGFYFSEWNHKLEHGHDIGGETLEGIFNQLDEEDKKEFISECASLLAKSKKKKSAV